MGKEKDLLQEYNLGGVRERMMQLSEYSFRTGIVEDDEDNQQQPQDPNGQQMPMDNQQGGMMRQQGQQPPMGQQDQMAMPPQGDMGGQQPMGDPNQMSMDGQADAQPVETGDMPPMDNQLPDEGMGMDVVDGTTGEDEPIEGDEEVIDVDDLTQSQEATEYKIDGVNDKLSQLLQVTTKFVDALQDNERQIEDLRQEFERRNPTPEEKMNIRSQASYPYGETPKDYWDKKVAENPNYNVIYDNDVSPKDEDKEFEIKRSDLDNIDTKSLSDSLEFPKELRDYLDF